MTIPLTFVLTSDEAIDLAFRVGVGIGRPELARFLRILMDGCPDWGGQLQDQKFSEMALLCGTCRSFVAVSGHDEPLPEKFYVSCRAYSCDWRITLAELLHTPGSVRWPAGGIVVTTRPFDLRNRFAAEQLVIETRTEGAVRPYLASWPATREERIEMERRWTVDLARRAVGYRP